MPQEDLTALSTVAVAPATLASVVLFENSFQTSASQTIPLTNGGNSTVNFNVRHTAYCSCLSCPPRAHPPVAGARSWRSPCGPEAACPTWLTRPVADLRRRLRRPMACSADGSLPALPVRVPSIRSTVSEGCRPMRSRIKTFQHCTSTARVCMQVVRCRPMAWRR